MVLLAASWLVLYEAQRQHTLAVTGPYDWLRHPQYAAFVVIMLGFLLQWPTLLTLLMFPMLVTMHACASGLPGGARGSGRVWRGVCPLCCDHAGVLSTPWPYRA